jgi:hypothetical protein
MARREGVVTSVRRKWAKRSASMGMNSRGYGRI